MSSRQDLTLTVIFLEKLTVYDIDICCVNERISNILNLLREGPQCAATRERAPRTLS